MTDALFSGGFLLQAGDDFLAHGLGESVVHADLGAEAVVPLLSWDDLNAILSTGTLQPPRLRLHRQGSPVPVERYTQTATVGGERRAVVRPVELYAQLRDGASLIIEAIDRLHPPIRAAADDLIRLVREPVQANLYLLWGETHGFDAHWDDHDTVIVQVMGTKAWNVHGPGRTHPMRNDADADHTCPDAIVWEGVLEAGHALHVPRGWWHTVCGTGDVSLHLTFGFTRTTGIDWAARLIEHLRALDLFRRDLPRFTDREHSADHYRQLLHWLADTAAAHGPADLLAEQDQYFGRRQRFSLPWPMNSALPAGPLTVELATVIAPAVTMTRDAVALTTGGKRYTFKAAARPALDVLIRDRELTVADLGRHSGLGDAQLAALLRELVRQHLVLVR
ncbi:MAG: JmjC domain-containing protein [Pseudonocardiaceae bacterium]